MIKLHLYDDYQEALKVKQHLSYQLGSMFLQDMKSTFGIFKFPFSAYRTIKKFKIQSTK